MDTLTRGKQILKGLHQILMQEIAQEREEARAQGRSLGVELRVPDPAHLDDPGSCICFKYEAWVQRKGRVPLPPWVQRLVVPWMRKYNMVSKEVKTPQQTAYIDLLYHDILKLPRTLSPEQTDTPGFSKFIEAVKLKIDDKIRNLGVKFKNSHLYTVPRGRKVGRLEWHPATENWLDPLWDGSLNMPRNEEEVRAEVAEIVTVAIEDSTLSPNNINKLLCSLFEVLEEDGGYSSRDLLARCQVTLQRPFSATTSPSCQLSPGYSQGSSPPVLCENRSAWPRDGDDRDLYTHGAPPARIDMGCRTTAEARDAVDDSSTNIIETQSLNGSCATQRPKRLSSRNTKQGRPQKSSKTSRIRDFRYKSVGPSI